MGSANLKVNEPSMEDILASIRRIISEDHEPDSPEPEPSALQTVLDIAERHVATSFYPVAAPEPTGEEWPLAPSEPRRDERLAPRQDQRNEAPEPFHAPEPATAPAPTLIAQAAVQPCERRPGEALLSRAAEASVVGAFGQLEAAQASRPSPTVEDLMKEMLRPMLKAWLDDNLPDLVERLVQAEIRRVTRGQA